MHAICNDGTSIALILVSGGTCRRKFATIGTALFSPPEQIAVEVVAARMLGGGTLH